MTRPFNDSRPIEEWPESERFRILRHFTQRIPGTAETVLRYLIDEVERLSKRVSELEGGRPLSDALQVLLTQHPNHRPLRILAKDTQPGDILCYQHPPRVVVRFYPQGQSGNAPFAEVSFGGVCVGILPDEPVTVYRDPGAAKTIGVEKEE